MEYQLNGENFLLIINPKVFEEDIRLPSNTALEVIVQSNGFSAHTAMDIDIKEFAKFALDLHHIYETLSGEARIEEPYGVRMYISFIGNGRVEAGNAASLALFRHAGFSETGIRKEWLRLADGSYLPFSIASFNSLKLPKKKSHSPSDVCTLKNFSFALLETA